MNFSLKTERISFPLLFYFVKLFRTGEKTGTANVLQVKCLTIAYNKFCVLDRIILTFHFHAVPLIQCLNMSSAKSALFNLFSTYCAVYGNGKILFCTEKLLVFS